VAQEPHHIFLLAMAEPEAKKQKTEETKEDATPPELEKDAKPTSAKPLRADVGFETSDCTLNVIPSLGGRVLMPLTDGGMQYLIGGARANLGIKKGRYLYEVKVVEAHNPSEGPQRSFRSSVARNLVRVGFSLQGSSLLLGETSDCVYFDNDGFYGADQKRESTSQRFQRDSTVAVLLNLDASSTNANTVSLFKDGVRASQPQKLPQNLVGKPLFPHVSFKNTTLHVNFGSPLAPLPFKCLTVAEVPTSDGQVGPSPPKDGKYEVIFPVAVPDEGTFDWLDEFLEKNPQYVELSDRAIIKWAEKSGISHSEQNSWKNCNDKPDPQFRIPLLDDFSARRVIQAVAPTQPRHYVVMEVKSNLVKEERSQLLKRFTENYFKTVAKVVMGEPPSAFKEKVHKALLTEKQEKATQEWKRRKVEKEQERLQRKRARELEEAKKRAEEEAKRKLEEIERRAAEAAAAEAAAAAAAEKEAADAAAAADGQAEAKTDGQEAKPDVKMEESQAKPEVKEEKVEVKEEVKAEVKDEPMPEVKEEVKEEPEEPEEPCPQVELTAEDKATCFRKKATADLTSWTLGSYFTKFSIPEKDEGFGDVCYEWAAEAKAKEYLATYIRKSKITNRIEDLMPGEWFKTKSAEFHGLLEGWKSRQKEYAMRPPLPPQEEVAAEALAAAQAAALATAEAAQAQAQAAQADARPSQEGQGEAAPQPEGSEQPKAEPEGSQEAPKEEAPKEEAPKEEPKAEAKPPAEVDVMAVEDIYNVNEKPLFIQFAFEDWVLLNLRAELYLMATAFLKDAGDVERVGIHDTNLNFYYQKYFKKQLVPKQYGMETNTELVEKLLKDTMSFSSELVLESKYGEDLDFSLLVKLTEAARRDRQAKIDSGDDTAKLHVEHTTMPPPPPQMGGYKGDYKGYKGDKGGYKGYTPGYTQGYSQGYGQSYGQGFKGYGKDSGKKGFDKGKKGDKGFDKGFGKSNYGKGDYKGGCKSY